MILKIDNILWYTNGMAFGIKMMSHKTDRDPFNMKKNKALVTIFALALHLGLLFWAFQQMN